MRIEITERYENLLFDFREVGDGGPGLHVEDELLLLEQFVGTLASDLAVHFHVEQLLCPRTYEHGHDPFRQS